MALNDLRPAPALPEATHEDATIVRITGCPRCGTLCRFLDDCPVCLGEAPCARCLFGPRVDDDEIHATLVPEG
jgi:hypothetical protein